MKAQINRCEIWTIKHTRPIILSVYSPDYNFKFEILKDAHWTTTLFQQIQEYWLHSGHLDSKGQTLQEPYIL